MENKTSSTLSPQFSTIRSLLWPIHTKELSHFIPLALMIFCILAVYTVLHDLKDVLIVQNVGAHIIPYVKGTVVSTSAFTFVLIYVNLSNIFTQDKLFYIVVLFFLSLFLIFCYVLYPNVVALHPDVVYVRALEQQYPWALGFIHIWANWVYVLFYVSAELWGSTVLSLLFWSLANRTVSVTQSKRFYAMFIVLGNIAAISVGYGTSMYWKAIRAKVQYIDLSSVLFVSSVQRLLVFTVIVGVILCLVFRWMMRNAKLEVNQQSATDAGVKETAVPKQKQKASIIESFRLIFKSKELMCIAILVLAYGVAMNLFDVQWKYQLAQLYSGDPSGYSFFMARLSMYTGLASFIFGFFALSLLQRLKWKTVASVLPYLMLVVGSVFFFVIMFNATISKALKAFDMSVNWIAVMMGAGLLIFAKAIKFTLVDSTKEMAYIPLDDELKSKGKAAVDVVGGRLGKASGGYLQMLLLAIMQTSAIISIAPYSYIAFFLVVLLWIWAVKRLAKQMQLLNVG